MFCTVTFQCRQHSTCSRHQAAGGFVPFLRQTYEGIRVTGLSAHACFLMSCLLLVWGQDTLMSLQHFAEEFVLQLLKNSFKRNLGMSFLVLRFFFPSISSSSSPCSIYFIKSSCPPKWMKIKQKPAGASSYRHGCGRPRTSQPGAPGWRQRQAEDTRAGCGRRGRTDHSRHSHSQAENQTQAYRMCHCWKWRTSQLLYSSLPKQNTLKYSMLD